MAQLTERLGTPAVTEPGMPYCGHSVTVRRKVAEAATTFEISAGASEKEIPILQEILNEYTQFEERTPAPVRQPSRRSSADFERRW